MPLIEYTPAFHETTRIPDDRPLPIPPDLIKTINSKLWLEVQTDFKTLI